MNSFVLNSVWATSCHTGWQVNTALASVPRSSAKRAASFKMRAISASSGARPNAVAKIVRARSYGESAASFTIRPPQYFDVVLTKGSFSKASAWFGTFVASRLPVQSFGIGWLNCARNRCGSIIVILM